MYLFGIRKKTWIWNQKKNLDLEKKKKKFGSVIRKKFES